MDLDVTFFFQLALLAVLMVTLQRALFAPLLHVIETRQHKMHGLSHEVGRLNRLAQADEQAYAQKMLGARREAQTTREALRAAGREGAREVTAKARAAIVAANAQTREQVRQSEAAAAQTLAAAVEPLATQLVEKLLGRKQGT